MSDQKSMTDQIAEQVAQRVLSLLSDTGAVPEVLGFLAVLSDGTPVLYVEDGLARTALLGAIELAKDEILCMAQAEAHGDEDEE